jgi:hypothetical protein
MTWDRKRRYHAFEAVLWIKQLQAWAGMPGGWHGIGGLLDDPSLPKLHRDHAEDDQEAPE